MAYRLDRAVVRGELSNTKQGLITGKIWLAGEETPLELELSGNFLRDLAGCAVRFVNPHPKLDRDLRFPLPHQTGVTGDMTGSRKLRVPTVDGAELMDCLESGRSFPTRLANVLYLEWFSHRDERVVIEGADFRLDVSEPAWSMTEEEEYEQLAINQECFLQFLNRLAGMDLQATEEDDEEDDEVAWLALEEPPRIGEFLKKEDRDSRDGVMELADLPELSALAASQILPPALDAEMAALMQDDQEYTAWLQSQEKDERGLDALGADLDDLEAVEAMEDLSEQIRQEHLDALSADMAEMADLEGLPELPLNEFEWEREFRAADRKALAYQEAFDRYRHHPNRDQLIADAMGWDLQIVEDVLERQAELPDLASELADGGSQLQDLLDELEDEPNHPLSIRALRLGQKMQEDGEATGLLREEREAEGELPLTNAIYSVFVLASRLGNGLARVHNGSETGYVLAMLKRAQVPLNESLQWLDRLPVVEGQLPCQLWLATLRSELFDLRKDVLDLMQTLRAGA